VVFIAACLSVLAFHWHFHRGGVLLDGDAVAHINIARRVFDSKTPGPLQLGTVWLPLPHVLIMPFIVSDWMWRTGVGGSIPSMVAYVFAVLGIFRLVRRELRYREPDRAVTAAAYFAALMFALNPNLLYLQATAMTESLYLAFFVWAVVYLAEFADEGMAVEQRERALRNCGLCLAVGMLTRYDAWFAAGVIGCAVVLVGWRRAAKRGAEAIENRDLAPIVRPVRQIAKFLVIVAAVPALWLAYNGVVFGNALAFLTGPYSARAIEQRGYQAFGTHPPGFHSLHTAILYFLKTVQLDMGQNWWGKIWLAIAAAGVILVLRKARGLWPWMMLWIPLAFYSLSIAYTGASIHVPMWWPFSYYNLRYGVQLLPALAVFSAAAVYFLAGVLQERWKWTPAVVVGIAVLVSYNSIWSVPICLQEAKANSRTRVELESKLADVLEKLPGGSTILMYTGGHGGALQDAGIPFRRVIWEGNHGNWKHALARRGLWEEAIEHPARYVDYAVGFDEDEVSVSAQKNRLRRVAEIDVPGQARAVVYATGR
jgi:hypothetical protein